MNRLCTSAFLLLLATLLVAPRIAHAAKSYDNCTGFITSVPASISTEGTWCFNKNLSTAITSGTAIYINNNNVTIDCNDFKLEGQSAGLGTTVIGIGFGAGTLHNATVRHCDIRGFASGLYFGGNGGGHLVEDNRFEGNTFVGAEVNGNGSIVRRNLVLNTGKSTVAIYVYPRAISIFDSVDILDNTVSGVVAPTGTNSDASGIQTTNNLSGSISGNRVRGLVPAGTGTTWGISDNVGGNRGILRNNEVVGASLPGSRGLFCSSANSSAKGNTINGFAVGIDNCRDAGGNVIAP